MPAAGMPACGATILALNFDRESTRQEFWTSGLRAQVAVIGWGTNFMSYDSA
jgi:hypothetical protein